MAIGEANINAGIPVPIITLEDIAVMRDSYVLTLFFETFLIEMAKNNTIKLILEGSGLYGPCYNAVMSHPTNYKSYFIDLLGNEDIK